MTAQKILMVSPYAPYRDGIAVYAVQEVRELRKAGHQVEVLSPLPSAAHHHLGLGGPKGFTRLLSRVSGFDRVIIQIYPELVWGACRNPAQRTAAWAALAAVCKKVPTDLRVHELDYEPALKHRTERKAAQAAMKAAEVVSVHTPPEAEKLAEVFGITASLVDHGDYFSKRSELSKAGARSELGLDADSHVFLAIGFLQDHKGFDRAITAFASAQIPDSSLHIVGSVRVEVPELLAYADKLEQMSSVVPGVHLHRKFVGDDEFDRWIVAADTIVLPYREIWSSGVLERAKIYDRPVIASRVGGLADQVSEGSELFENDDELGQAMRRRAGMSESSIDLNNQDNNSEVSAARTREEIEAEVRAKVGVSNAASGSASSFQRNEALALAPASSARPGVGQIKRMIQAATAWQIRPLVERINVLEAQLAEAFERLEADQVNRADSTNDE